jgi:hypothetical protein
MPRIVSGEAMDIWAPDDGPRQRYPVVVKWVLLLTVILVGAGVVAGVNWVRFGVAEPWATPASIDHCGTTFAPGGEVMGPPASILAAHPSPLRHEPTEWTQVTRTLWLTPVYAIAVNHTVGACPLELYVPVGHGTYRTYGRGGGP